MTIKITSVLRHLLVLPLFLAAVKTHAQDIISQSFRQYNDHVLTEKVYVHTDRNFYMAGEIMWFKVYNVDAGTLHQLDISKVVYADVLDEANNAVLQAKIALDKGRGNGSFYIPVNLKNGNYKLRAYTNWMKNFSADRFFEKTITIVNSLTEPVATTAMGTVRPPAIQFFAEGGNLVAGATSTVGFKVTGADGKGIDASGVITNERNETVARFETLKFGMGSFELTPDANSTYKAVVRIGSNNSLISELPPVAAKGYAIHLTGTYNQTNLVISTRGVNEPLYLFIHSGRTVIVAQSVVTNANGNATISIDRLKLGRGVNHITLFNSAKQPVCERLIFSRPDALQIRAQVQSQYKLRSLVAIPVTVAPAANNTVPANMSIAVFKADSLNHGDDLNIDTYLWLTSELKGNIESPDYYFSRTPGVISDEVDRALDNLLLVQGWSRFKWDEVLNGKQKFTYLPEYDGHLVTGQLRDAYGKPAPKITAYMGVPGKRLQLYGSTADSTGRLLFNTKQLYGPGEIVVQTNTEIDSTYKISINNPFSEQYSSIKLPAFKLIKQWQKALEFNSMDMQVQNIYVPNKLKQYTVPVVDSSVYFGNNHKKYFLENYTRFTTMEEVLREYVVEVLVGKTKNRVRFNVLNGGEFTRDQPMVILDGVPIFNLDRVFAIDPLKIRELDMMKYKNYWGPITSNGVINMISYKGDMAGFDIDPKAVVLDYEGMQLQREFYSPIYETPEQQKSRVPDFRHVLYWAPDVNTDATGKANVSFYTSDKPGKYIAVIQGIDRNGLVGSYKLKFDVVK
ncbi:hypothetical protein ACFQZS_09565 [Mucilaginibacter calamicampi]|uniref:MG2 domain-containing protein n=1 Tax=Mucilaginibacter calamicampi TaxID=1302352 RepID=A0ABW2YX59_9SPHI